MKRSLYLLAAIGLMLAPAAHAQGKGTDRDRDRAAERSEWTSGPLAQDNWGNQFSPGQARDSVREGKTVPLKSIFKMLQGEYGGYQLGADLYARESGGPVYEIDWRTGDGRNIHVTVDAETGAILDRNGG